MALEYTLRIEKALSLPQESTTLMLPDYVTY